MKINNFFYWLAVFYGLKNKKIYNEINIEDIL